MKSKLFPILLTLFIVICSTNKGFSQTPMQVSGTATKTASVSGNWSSNTTWGGSLPVNYDRILIPNGVTIIVDGMVTEKFKSIRIADGGKLQFATNTDTELRTEYIFSAPNGTLEIGTNANKIPVGTTASLVFAEMGALPNGKTQSVSLLEQY